MGAILTVLTVTGHNDSLQCISSGHILCTPSHFKKGGGGEMPGSAAVTIAMMSNTHCHTL